MLRQSVKATDKEEATSLYPCVDLIFIAAGARFRRKTKKKVSRLSLMAFFSISP